MLDFHWCLDMNTELRVCEILRYSTARERAPRKVPLCVPQHKHRNMNSLIVQIVDLADGRLVYASVDRSPLLS